MWCLLWSSLYRGASRTLKETREVTGPLAAERLVLPAGKRTGHQAGMGALPQHRCGTAVKCLGLGQALSVERDPACWPQCNCGLLFTFICSEGCWSCSAGLLSITLPGHGVQTLYLYQPKNLDTQQNCTLFAALGSQLWWAGSKVSRTSCFRKTPLQH